MEQLSELQTDPAVLDHEGRCVILEFPAFVLLGLYCPAARNETRDDFRQGFITLLDARIRNLVAMGKRVIVAGDLNISAGEIDSAHLTEAIRKGTGSEDEFVSSPVRRVFNQLVEGGKVIGNRDSGREAPVLHDICRSFHPHRRGMYTCWETRVNARPGNYGARIDYILSSLDMKDWWSEGNIQEGLLVCFPDVLRGCTNLLRAPIIVPYMRYSRRRCFWTAKKLILKILLILLVCLKTAFGSVNTRQRIYYLCQVVLFRSLLSDEASKTCLLAIHLLLSRRIA